MFDTTSWIATGLMILANCLKGLAWGLDILAIGLRTLAIGLENLPAVDSYRTQPVLHQQDGNTTEASTSHDSKPVLHQQFGNTTEASTSHDSKPVFDQQDGNTTEAVGCFYAFYFWKYPLTEDNLDGWRHDRNSVSQIVSSINGKVGHFRERRNLKKEEFLRFLKKIRSSRETSSDYLFFYLLSHGNAMSEIITHDNSTVPIMDIINHFREDNCERFRGKPKIFVFQCCRGYFTQPSHSPPYEIGNYSSNSTMESIRNRLNSENLRIRRSLGNNMFVAYAATPDHAAYDTYDKGSFFTNCFRKVILRNGNKDNINMLMTRVNSHLSCNKWMPQMSFFVNRLTQEFHFCNTVLSQDSKTTDDDSRVSSGAETDTSSSTDPLAFLENVPTRA